MENKENMIYLNQTELCFFFLTICNYIKNILHVLTLQNYNLGIGSFLNFFKTEFTKIRSWQWSFCGISLHQTNL